MSGIFMDGFERSKLIEEAFLGGNSNCKLTHSGTVLYFYDSIWNHFVGYAYYTKKWYIKNDRGQWAKLIIFDEAIELFCQKDQNIIYFNLDLFL